jgi:hypothetical protein
MVREQLHKLVDDVLDLRSTLVGDRVPPEARRHFRTARKEALLGVRAVVDHALSRLEQSEQEAQPEAQGARSIQVES